MAIRGWCCALILGTTIGCGGEEFQSGSGGTSSGGASSGGASNGGTSGSAATGGASTGGVAGSINPSGGGSGNLGGQAGDGGSGGGIPGCALKPGAPILLHTTLDDSSAIQTPDKGIPPGSSQGALVPGMCPSAGPNGALAITTTGDYLTYPADQNINLVTGTVDFYFKSTTSSAGIGRHLLAVPGKFQISIDSQGNLVVGVGPNVARIIDAGDVPFSTNTWVRVTITWKFGNEGETVFVYFDGNGVGGQYNAGPFNVPPIEGDPLFIGATGENDAQVAQGELDDIKIYDGTEEP